MRIEAHIAQLETEGDLLMRAALAAGPDAPVPTCPGWRVRDLVHHIGDVHRWAASFVRDKRVSPGDRPETAAVTEPADGDLDVWFRDGHAALVAALRAADPDLACWSFLPAPSPLAFWARRQAHETAIHRVDAQRAAGDHVTPVPAEFAADGLAELLECFIDRPRGSLVADPPVTLGVRAVDTGQAWTVHIAPEGRRVSTDAAPADLVLSGPATDLYLLLWNRSNVDNGKDSSKDDSGGVRADGDLGVWELWRERARIAWS